MTSNRPATYVWLSTVVTFVLAIVLTPHGQGSIGMSLGIGWVVLVFASVGWLLCQRARGNVIGPLFLAISALATFSGVAEAYARRGFQPGSGLPGAMAAAVISNSAQGSPLVVGLVYLVLLFPDGTIADRRLRPLGWIAAVAAVAALAYTTLDSKALDETFHRTNPIAVTGVAGDVIDQVGNVGYLVLLLVMAAASGSLIVRFRRAEGALRQQLKVLGAAAALLVITFACGAVVLFPHGDQHWAKVAWLVLFVIGVSALPLATGIAIVRYRLYGIDAVLRRTLVYAALVASLGALYLGGIVTASAVSRAVSGQSSKLAVTLSTLAVAVLAQPLRRRIQRVVDRRFFRSRYDAQATLALFAERLRDEVDIDTLAEQLVRVAGQCVLPTHASVTLRPVTIPERRTGTTERTWRPS